MLLTLLISAPAAYALSSLFVPGRRLFNFLLIVAQMVPAVVMALGFYTIYVQLGILDTDPGADRRRRDHRHPLRGDALRHLHGRNPP